MIDTILIVIIDILAFFFMFRGIYCLTKTKADRFLWNKTVYKINESKIKQYNKTVAFLYVFLGLLFLIIGIIGSYINYMIARILFVILIIAGMPTLISFNMVIANMYVETNEETNKE